MTYNNQELKEFESDKPIIFDPPKLMICWDHENFRVTPEPTKVLVFDPRRECRFITECGSFIHGAEEDVNGIKLT